MVIIAVRTARNCQMAIGEVVIGEEVVGHH